MRERDKPSEEAKPRSAQPPVKQEPWRESRDREQQSHALEGSHQPAPGDPAHDLWEGHGRPSAPESPSPEHPIPSGPQDVRAPLVSQKPDRQIEFRAMVGYCMLYLSTLGAQNPTVDVHGNSLKMPQRFMKFMQTTPLPEMPPVEEPEPEPEPEPPLQ